MPKTIYHKIFEPIKNISPNWIHVPIRTFVTMLVGPIRHAYRKGFYHSCVKRSAVSKTGEFLPWYTYPAIDFLKFRTYTSKNILEFGSGNSTLWWAKRAKHVVALEADPMWFEKIKKQLPVNVDLIFAPGKREKNVEIVDAELSKLESMTFDVVIIDGLHRIGMIPFAIRHLSDDGIIICDNAESYEFYENLKNSGLFRVDFFGGSPGVLLPHATSIYFKPSSFIFNANHPIPYIDTYP